MTHHQYIPQLPLRQFIAGFTYYKDYKPQHTIDRYLPNGNVEIIIDLTDDIKYIYDNATLAAIQSYKKIWLSGIRNNFITIPSGLNAEMFIIEFKKGMAYPFLGRPLTEITERVIEGDIILDSVFLNMRDVILSKTSPAEMFTSAEEILIKKFQSKLIANPFVDFAVNKIISSPSALTIKSVADKTGFSSKHFIKIFNDNVGVTPKLFLRIIRFQKAINEMEIKGSINWAALAFECGYYDQAHFINDFKNFSGFTPVDYMKYKNSAVLNYIPVG